AVQGDQEGADRRRVPDRHRQGRSGLAEEGRRGRVRQELAQSVDQGHAGRQVGTSREGRSHMSVLIKGGRIVTAADDYVGDVFVENGTVTLIGESLDVTADKTIDAAGKYVIPGAIDPHTHLEMFFGGTTTCDDFTSGTTAAAFGGT